MPRFVPKNLTSKYLYMVILQEKKQKTWYDFDMKKDSETEIRYVRDTDESFWFTLDKHLLFAEFQKKVRDKQGYILLQNGIPVGILRYNLFWDNTPFCTLLYVKEGMQRKGLEKKLMQFWENEMKALGFDWVLVSTQKNENAQYFYRAIGYIDCGNLTAPDQTVELLLNKRLSN